MGKGGARWGAGRPSFKVKAEQLLRIDIRQWRKSGLLWDGGSNSWRWSRGDEPAGTIKFTVSANAVYLGYSIDGNDASQSIATTTTPCGYGGSRRWFSCPVCRRRCEVLYMRSARFACRSCQRVSYTSQSEDVIGRLWRTQRKIEERLGEGWQRPKGMREHTYERLWATLMDCERRRDEEFAVVVQRFMGIR